MTEDITLREKINATNTQRLEPSIELDSAPQNIASQSPFADKTDTMSDFFEGGGRIEQLDEAIHLSQFGNNIALITGDTGTGKTFFLEQACFELSETAACCFINGSTELTNVDIAKEVSTELSMPFASSQTIEQLIDMLDDADALQDVSRFIIIVDDIHLITEDIISSLLHLSQLSNNVFHLLASGLPSTHDYLESLESQDGLIKEIHLFPYGLEDTRDYLNFKMKSAGYEGENFFDPETVAALYKESAGYPARINQATESFLLTQEELTQEEELTEEKSSEARLGLPLWHMVGLVFLLFALILAFFYRGTGSNEDVEQTLPVTIENNATETVAEETLKENPSDSTQAAPLAEGNQSEALEQTAAEQTGEATAETITETIAETTSQSTQAINETVTEVIDNSVSEAAAVVGEATDNSAAVIEATEQPPAAAATELTTEQAEAVAQNTAPAASATEAAPTAAFSADEQVVLNWPENDSTIQIIGALDKASLERYVAAQVNSDALRLVTILRDGNPWHIVVADHYPNNDQARQAIQRLPQNQVNAGPWIRKVTDLKQGIRAFRR